MSNTDPITLKRPLESNDPNLLQPNLQNMQNKYEPFSSSLEGQHVFPEGEQRTLMSNTQGIENSDVKYTGRTENSDVKFIQYLRAQGQY